MSNCIHERNPAGGFCASHKRFCAYCDSDATRHANVDGRWCGNICSEHAKRLAARGKAVDIQAEIYLAEAA